MLKKAGIAVALSAAGLLSVSPLAFAGDYSGDSDHHHHHDSDHSDHHEENVSCKQRNSAEDNREGRHGGLINVSDIAVQVPVQACNNSVVEGVLGIFAKNQRNDDSHGDD